MRHIGVALHKTNFVACFIASDETQRLETYPRTRGGLARFVAQLDATDELAVEATQNVHYFYDQVRAHVARLAVVDTYRFGVVAKSKKKTDKADASALARFLKLGWLPEVPVPSAQVRTLRQLLQARETLVGGTGDGQPDGHTCDGVLSAEEAGEGSGQSDLRDR
jgi:transposase